jgi:hypothetical protein
MAEDNRDTFAERTAAFLEASKVPEEQMAYVRTMRQIAEVCSSASSAATWVQMYNETAMDSNEERRERMLRDLDVALRQIKLLMPKWHRTLHPLGAGYQEGTIKKPIGRG